MGRGIRFKCRRVLLHLIAQGRLYFDAKSLSENHLREGHNPILLPGHRKIGTVPDGSRIGSKLVSYAKRQTETLSPLARLMLCIGGFAASLAWLRNRPVTLLPDINYFFALLVPSVLFGACIGALFGRTKIGAALGCLLLGGLFLLVLMTLVWRE